MAAGKRGGTASAVRGASPLGAGIPGALPGNVLGGSEPPPTDDPAFQPPGDPTKDISALIGRARIITREIPNVSLQTGWTVSQTRGALVDLTSGLFDRPAQLQDAIAADSRVMSAMRSLSGGLLGKPLRFKLPPDKKNDKRAQQCLDAWETHWPEMAPEPALLQLLETSGSLGFAYSQILWDTAADQWMPYLQDFNARYSYYHWRLRKHVVVTQDGQVPVDPGDGHWVLHAPYGTYRGWMRGSLRAVAQWWLARSYALRDWARYCERHGFPILLADTPFGADPDDVYSFSGQLAGIGQESVLQLPGSVNLQEYGKYDLRYLEPKDDNWQAFKELIAQCNAEITLALLAQNLTSEVKEGSFAAARVHGDVRQTILEASARALARTLYVQVARPFAALNYGDADLAPRIAWDVRPVEDQHAKAQTFREFASAMLELRQAGYELDNAEQLARSYGLGKLKLRAVPFETGRAPRGTGRMPHAEQRLDRLESFMRRYEKVLAKAA